MARSAWPRRCLDDRRHRANSSRHSIAPYSRGGCGQGCVIRAASLNTAERHRGRASIEAVRVQGWRARSRIVDSALATLLPVVPEGVDFDCLSASGSYDPVADLRIHPGKLITFFALLQQAVGWIQPDTESSAANLMLDDVDQLRKQKLQRVAVTGCREISFNGMKVPQGGIRRVVQTLLLTFWKHVRYQSVADVVRKRPQDVSCLDVTAGNQGEFLETDHRVAPPIGKPVITAITVPTSSPVACARAASATRVLGVMMN